jgi:hypothetical protein
MTSLDPVPARETRGKTDAAFGARWRAFDSLWLRTVARPLAAIGGMRSAVKKKLRALGWVVSELRWQLGLKRRTITLHTPPTSAADGMNQFYCSELRVSSHILTHIIQQNSSSFLWNMKIINARSFKVESYVHPSSDTSTWAPAYEQLNSLSRYNLSSW